MTQPRQNQNNTRLVKRILRACLVPALAFCAAIFMSACSNEISIAGKTLDRQATSADLSDCGIVDAESVRDLRKLRKLTALDLRENSLTGPDFDTIQSFIPKCSIRWSVPLGAARYDSESETLAVPDFSQGDLAALGYFPHLVSLDASGSDDYAALIAAEAEYPDVLIRWTCIAAGMTFSSADETIVCATGTTLSDIATLLTALPKLKTVDVRNTDVLAGDIATLQGEHPEVAFLTQAYLLGERYDTTKTSLQLAAAESFDAKQLGDQLVFFPRLTELDLREVPAVEQDISALSERYPALQIHWMVPILEALGEDGDTEPLNLRVDSDTESLDLRGYTISDLATFKQKLKWLKKLTYLDLCNCGPSDQEMAQLRSEFPQVKVVWMLHVGYWEIRTDIKGFSMAQYGEHEGVRFTKIGEESRRYRWVDNEQIAKLRYCTDIVALDIGHSHLISDISFVRELPKLRFLVISLTKVRDLSPVRTLKNLIFFEMFDLKQTDVSVLYDLPQLEYLNCSANLITDIKPFLSLTNLKRLWIIKCGFPDETLHALKVGLPNTIVIAKGKHPTDTGWRFGFPEYLEMQALFGLAPQLDWASAEYLLPENQIP